MHTKAVVTVNGQPVAGLFWEKLIRITVTDNEGNKADTIDILLEDGPPFMAIPKKDDEIMCWLGYEDGPFDYMGRFKVNDVEAQMIPWKLSIKGKSADMKETLKQHRRRHFDGETFGDIVSKMAGEHGLVPQIDEDLASFKPENSWLGQENESDQHWIQRWSDRMDGLFAVKDGKLIVAKRGSGLTAGGAAMMAVVVTPPMIVKGTARVHWGDREKHKKMRGEYHDQKSGKRKYEDADSVGDADSVYTHRHAASGKNEARRAARGRARHLKSDGVTTSVTIEGNPFVKAGAPMTYAGVRPQVDGIGFIIEAAVHSYSKGAGYRTEIRGKSKDGDTGGEQ